MTGTTRGRSNRPGAGGERAGFENRTEFELDQRRVRQAFDRAAPAYEDAATVIGEIGRRLLEHLDPIRLSPQRILDVGSGPGTQALELERRYREARVYGIDLSREMLATARKRQRRRWFRRSRYVCADAGALPLADARVQLVFSNAMLEWCNDPDAVFRELARVLAPGGLLVLSTLGPDTLGELRRIWAQADGFVHVHRFIDMHDLGDALVRAGFTGVVMETERLTVQYPSLDALFTELRRCGSVNAARGRNPGLTGRGRLNAVREAYERLRHEGRLPASCEVIYAHAWRAAPRQVQIPREALHRGEF